MTQNVAKSPPKTQATTQADPYKTEFVKVYQDAGVIGVAMLTLLVIAAILSILLFRLTRMYGNLVTARDQLDAARVTVIEKLTENIIGIRAESGTLRNEIHLGREEVSRGRDLLLSEMRKVCDRVDEAIEDRSGSDRGRRSPRSRG